jgi:hypothetical protein
MLVKHTSAEAVRNWHKGAPGSRIESASVGSRTPPYDHAAGTNWSRSLHRPHHRFSCLCSRWHLDEEVSTKFHPGAVAWSLSRIGGFPTATAPGSMKSTLVSGGERNLSDRVRYARLAHLTVRRVGCPVRTGQRATAGRASGPSTTPATTALSSSTPMVSFERRIKVGHSRASMASSRLFVLRDSPAPALTADRRAPGRA